MCPACCALMAQARPGWEAARAVLQRDCRGVSAPEQCRQSTRASFLMLWAHCSPARLAALQHPDPGAHVLEPARDCQGHASAACHQDAGIVWIQLCGQYSAGPASLPAGCNRGGGVSYTLPAECDCTIFTAQRMHLGAKIRKCLIMQMQSTYLADSLCATGLQGLSTCLCNIGPDGRADRSANNKTG